MSYYRASTANPNGWRPGTVRLSGVNNGPDWKVALSHANAIQNAQSSRYARLQRAAMARMQAIDAAARGVASPVIYRGLSGLSGLLPSSTRMVNGAAYVFHFTGSNLLVASLSSGLQAQIAADSNFVNPVVSAEPNGMRVSFVYGGGGTAVGDTVGNYGAEMQNVLRSQSILGNGFLFSGAEGGPVQASTNTQVFLDANGNLVDASGNIISQGTSNPGDPSQNPSPNSAFSWSTFLAGMGLSVGVGTALAIGLGVLLLKD